MLICLDVVFENRPRSPFIGALVLIAGLSASLFFVVQVWEFVALSWSIEESTVPFEEYQVSRNISFKFWVHGARVNATDLWRNRQTRFLDQQRIGMHNLYNYSFPVGWEIVDGQLERSVNLTFSLDSKGGFVWALSATPGSVPHREMLLPAWWKNPVLSGFFSGVRHEGPIRTNTYVAAHKPVVVTGVSSFQVPNRRLIGTDRVACLTSVTLSVLATPLNVSVEADSYSGRSKQAYQSYLLTQVVPPFAENRTFEVGTACPYTNVTLKLMRNNFMVHRQVTRNRTIVQFLGQLVGSLGGIAKSVGSVAFAYMWLKNRLRSVLKKWSHKKEQKDHNLFELVVPNEELEQATETASLAQKVAQLTDQVAQLTAQVVDQSNSHVV